VLLCREMCPGPVIGGPWKSWLRVGPRKCLGLRESTGNTWIKTLRSIPYFQWRSETTPKWIKDGSNHSIFENFKIRFFGWSLNLKHLIHFQDKLNYCWLRELWSKVFVFFLQWLLLSLISFFGKGRCVRECFHLAYLVVVFMLLWRHRITKDVSKTRNTRFIISHLSFEWHWNSGVN